MTTDAVVTEFANYFAKSPFRREAAAFVAKLHRWPGWHVLPLDVALRRRGELRYARFADKNWSLTDCLGMELLTTRRLRRAATSDAGFAQAGFDALLR